MINIFVLLSLALASGNTGKKMHLDVLGRNNNITSSSTKKVNVTGSCPNGFPARTQTKRNLFSQINSPNNFVRPTSAVKQMRAKTVKTMATLRVPTLSLLRRRVSYIQPSGKCIFSNFVFIPCSRTVSATFPHQKLFESIAAQTWNACHMFPPPTNHSSTTTPLKWVNTFLDIRILAFIQSIQFLSLESDEGIPFHEFVCCWATRK